MKIISNKPMFSFNLDDEKAIIVIPAIKKNLLKIYSLVAAIGSFVVSIFGFFYILIEEEQLISAILGAIACLFVSAVYFRGYSWLNNGYEYIEINKKTNLITQYKKGWYVFDKKKIPLAGTKFQLMDEYAYVGNYGEADLAYGYVDGKIHIKTQERSYEIGISISDEQAKDLIVKINNFIQCNDNSEVGAPPY